MGFGTTGSLLKDGEGAGGGSVTETTAGAGAGMVFGRR